MPIRRNVIRKVTALVLDTRRMDAARIVLLAVVAAIGLLSTGLPLWVLDDGVEAQNTTINLVNNLTGGTSIGNPLDAKTVGNEPDDYLNPTSVSNANRQGATAFTTGSNTDGYTITEVQARLASFATTYEPVVTLHADNSGVPADAVLATFTTPSPLTLGESYETITFTHAGYHVSAGTYHIKFADAGTSSTAIQHYFVEWVRSATPTAATGWSIASGADYRIGSGTWSSAANPLPYRIGVRGFLGSNAGVTVDTDTTTDDVQSGAIAITEGSTAAYSMVLNTAPTGDVMVTPTVPSGLSISPATLTFTTTNWSVAQSFTITAEHDDDLSDAAGLSITHVVTGYGSIGTADAVTVNVTDDDAANITASTTSLAVNEEGMATYTIVLDFQPSSDVTVTITQPTNTDVTIDTDAAAGDQNTLTFTDSDWNMAQAVTVSAADDTDRTDDTATIAHVVSQSGGDMEYATETIADITVTVNDNDVMVLSKSALTVAEGSSGSYTVVLATAPTSNATVNLTLSDNIGVTIDTDLVTAGDQTSLRFTTSDWSSPQTVTVNAPEDNDGFANTGTVTHVLSGGGLSARSVLTTEVTEDEEVGIELGSSAVLVEADNLYTIAVDEGTSSGASNQYTVKLLSQPFPTTSNVTVAITAPAGQLTLKKTGQTTGSKTVSLTFSGTNWDTAQTITLIAGEDDDSSETTYSVDHVATGANFDGATKSDRDLNVTVSDDDSPNLVFSKTSFDLHEGDVDVTDTYTVKLATQPAASTTVTVTLTQPSNTDVVVDTDAMAGDQNTLTFTSANWNSAKTVTVRVKHDADAGDESGTIVHSVSQTGTDPEYNSTDVPDRNVVVNVDDDEVAGITGIASSRSLNHASTTCCTQTGSPGISLATPPTSDVTISVTVVGVEPAPDSRSGYEFTQPDMPQPASLTFTPTDYGAKHFRVRYQGDADAEVDKVRWDYTVSQPGGRASTTG